MFKELKDNIIEILVSNEKMWTIHISYWRIK